MLKEYIGEGKDLLEATSAAKEGLISSLGLKNDDDVKIEIICDFKKKTLGLFGGSLAKVKAFIELPDPKPEKKQVPKRNEKVAKAENSVAVPEKKREEKQSVQPADEKLLPAEQFAPDSSVGKASAYIKKIMEGLGCENVKVFAAEQENGVYLHLDGDKLGVVIGRRGETLDALQYLTSLAANTGNGYCKVTLNIGNYREKREKTLVSLANRVAAQVVASGRGRTLEPMNPYERRVIHTAVQEIPGVVSVSVGEGSNRRVVISPENGDRRPPRRDGARRNDRRPTSSTGATAPSREPKKDATDTDVPLYGRLN